MSILFITNKYKLGYPLAVLSLLCDLGLAILYLTGMRGAEGGRQPAAANPPL